MARGRGRELAFQALFQAEQGQSPLKEVWKDLRMEASQGHPWQDDDSDDTNTNPQSVNTEAFDRETLDFSEKLLNHFDDNREKIDSTLENELEGWTFKQMAQTDLSVLRLALAEIFYEETPEEVTINMAVRIAKKYGGEESGKFVNGVLGRYFRKLDTQKDDAGEDNSVEADTTSEINNPIETSSLLESENPVEDSSSVETDNLVEDSKTAEIHTIVESLTTLTPLTTSTLLTTSTTPTEDSAITAKIEVDKVNTDKINADKVNTVETQDKQRLRKRMKMPLPVDTEIKE